MSRVWRVHHRNPTDSVDGLVRLSTDEGHHVYRVLRLRAGDPIRVFDGQGNEWDATLTECRSGHVELQLGNPCTDVVEPALDVVLYQGLCRPERMEWVIQKATEWGCSAVHPVATARGPGPRLTDARLARWRRVALEACKQSGRRRLPEVEAVATLPAPTTGVLALLLDPQEGVPSLGERMAGEAPETVWVAVGPESGFGDVEIQAYASSGWQPTSLGPRTLRTETAGMAAAVVLLNRWADLGAAR